MDAVAAAEVAVCFLKGVSRVRRVSAQPDAGGGVGGGG